MIKTITLLIFSISVFTTIPLSDSSSGEITKYKDKNGKVSYTNFKIYNADLEIIETVSTKPQASSVNKNGLINYQLENLFNDKNTNTKLLSGFKKNRNNLGQLLINYQRQLEETQFELNANTVTLDRCYINPVYDYLILFCSGLESKQLRLFNELDLISNSIGNIRSQIIALDIQINGLETQYKSEVCTVNEILSGDSFICAFGNGLKTVKLIGVKTPDTSTEFLESLILGKKVLLRFGGRKTDINNSLLAYVFIDNTTMLNALLLRQGMGLALSNYEYKYIYEFNEYEELAKESKLGIWGN